MGTARCAGTLVSMVLAMAPPVVNAQTTTSSASGADPDKPRLFLEAPPPSTTLWIGPPTSIDFRSLPTTGHDVPRWTVDWKAVASGPRGSAFSVGVVSQRGNPLPLYWSQGTGPSNTASVPMIGPGMYRDQAGVTVGIRSPSLKIKGAEVAAFADLFVPVTNYCVKSPVSQVLSSPVLRAGIVTTY